MLTLFILAALALLLLMPRHKAVNRRVSAATSPTGCVGPGIGAVLFVVVALVLLFVFVVSMPGAFDELVAAQGGNPVDLARLGEIHKAPIIREMLAPTTGKVSKVDAGLIGQAALQLGAGRAKSNDGVDFAVGFDQLVKTGEAIHAGQPLCRIHARSAVDLDMAEAMAGKAVRIASH